MSKRDRIPVAYAVVAVPPPPPVGNASARIFSIIDPRTGQEVSRWPSIESAQAEQARLNTVEASRDY